MTDDISYTLTAKSDQLNAGDLFGGGINVLITRVDLVRDSQPMVIHIDGDRQPYKPCLSMRRVLARIWGTKKDAWVGRWLTVYCDEKVRFGPDAVGGIRISHASHIDGTQSVTVRASKHKVVTYEILPLSVELPAYSDEDIENNEAAWKASFAENKSSPGHMINQIKTKFTLTATQEQTILSLASDT